MVCVAGEGQGTLEIWDLLRGGDEPLKKTLEISQSVRVGDLAARVSRLCDYKMGTFGLILQWDRIKVDLKYVKSDRTLGEIGVDFTSGNTYVLLVTEWSSSPSEGDEQTMPCVDGGGPSVLLEILDLSRGARSNLEIGPATRVIDLFHYVVFVCNHKAGTFGLILRYGRKKIELNDKDTRKLAELGVDLSSPSSVMLLVTETVESPNADTETKTSTPTDDYPPETISPSEQDFHRILIKTTDQDFQWTDRKSEDGGIETKCSSTEAEFFDDTEEGGVWSSDMGVPRTSEKKKIRWVQKNSGEENGEENDEKVSEPEWIKQKNELYIGEYAKPSEDSKLSNVTLHSHSMAATSKGDLRRHKYVEIFRKKIRPDPEDEKDYEVNLRSEPELNLRSDLELNQRSESELNQRSPSTYVGLVNQAMTCYLNSLIQALYMTPEFRNALYNWEYVHGSEKDEANSIPYQLQKLFVNLQTSSKNAIETTSLTKSFGWDSTEAWQQHDIQELCRVMFDALEQKFKKTEQADLINRLYEGKMIDYVKCLECGTEKSREDTFLDIPLPVKPFGSNVAYNSVEEALAAFVQPETLDGTNQYHCETCNKKCDAHKGLKFTRFPYLLTLHLKRFDFDYNTFHRIKLNDEVTFPDVLNLNSFIPSTTTQDSPCADDDGGVGVKCDDSSTTDSGTLDDECPPCDNGMPVSENSTNQDHDDDEGIDMSNGPSTSSCSTHNHDNEKNRGNRPGPRGPYEYELFSIMIHSGSASGGHYYAYIKDFRTGEWLCFNDQNVSPITDDDIQKTYGGGPTRTYYNGVYSSSTNAYMLMYRQIDPTRNALPMQVDDFPKHLKELLTKLQANEYHDMKNRELLMRSKLKVLCRRPNEKTFTYTDIICPYDESLAQLTDRVYKTLGLENIVDREQVRLVSCQDSTGMIECSFEGREDESFRSLFPDQQDLLLEIRKKDEEFKTYLPGGLATKVYVVDVAKKEVVKGPINVRAHRSQTVLKYKEQLSEIIGMEPDDINLILLHPNSTSIRLLSNNDSAISWVINRSRKIFVPTVTGADTTKTLEETASEIMEAFGTLSSVIVELPDTSKEALRELSIPSLEEVSKEKPAETSAPTVVAPVTTGPPKSSGVTKSKKRIKAVVNEGSVHFVDTPASSSSKASVDETSVDTVCTPETNVTITAPTKVASSNEGPGFWNETTSPPATQPEGEEWHTPEQSNSEDSSLSYSDRTLVGEGDASEDDDYPLAGADNEFFNQPELENWDIDDQSEYYFKATRDEDDPEKTLRVLVDTRMSLGAFKKCLEPYVGVPAQYFKVFHQNGDETECSRLAIHEEGETLCLKLGRALRSGEYKVKLHQLIIDSNTENYKYLCEWIVSKEATVGQTKKEILAELKRKFDIDIPFERCRLRRKNYKTASKVFLNDQKFKDLHLYWPYEIIVQELPDTEQVTGPDDIVFFIRRVIGPNLFLGPIEEVVMNIKSDAELRENLTKISGIPDEHLQVAKGKSRMSWDVMWLMFEKVLDNQSSVSDNCLPISPEDGSFIYYRDSRHRATEPVADETQNGGRSQAKSRMLGITSSSRFSPRRERALKIYVDDK